MNFLSVIDVGEISCTGCIEVLNVKVHVFVLLIFATLPDCSQNQTAVSDTLRLLSDVRYSTN